MDNNLLSVSPMLSAWDAWDAAHHRGDKEKPRPIAQAGAIDKLKRRYMENGAFRVQR